MSIPMLTTGQYDQAEFIPLGTVIVNRVEAISLVRGAVASIGSILGGQSSFIQTAIDKLQTRSMADFVAKVKSTYPNTQMVIKLNTDISDVGRDSNASFMVMTITGTCLGVRPTSQNAQAGGSKTKKEMRRKTRKANSKQ